jgi:phosphorylcholine metabolism protein LicD
MGDLRNKNESDLNRELKGLIEIRDILNHLNFNYHLAGGALLGAVRDRDFIK